MIIWTGWGILLLPIVGLSIGSFLFLWTSLGLAEQSPFISNLSLLLAFSLAGIVSWYVGKALNKPKGDVYVNQTTGEAVRMQPRHSFFFVRIEHWGVALPIIGVIVYFIASIQGSSMTF